MKVEGLGLGFVSIYIGIRGARGVGILGRRIWGSRFEARDVGNVVRMSSLNPKP